MHAAPTDSVGVLQQISTSVPVEHFFLKREMTAVVPLPLNQDLWKSGVTYPKHEIKSSAVR